MPYWMEICLYCVHRLVCCHSTSTCLNASTITNGPRDLACCAPIVTKCHTLLFTVTQDDFIGSTSLHEAYFYFPWVLMEVSTSICCHVCPGFFCFFFAFCITYKSARGLPYCWKMVSWDDVSEMGDFFECFDSGKFGATHVIINTTLFCFSRCTIHLYVGVGFIQKINYLS